jgi:hypothetical protein
MNLVRKQKISVIKIILHNFQKKINQNLLFILENSDLKLRPKTQDPLKIKNEFSKLRTITQNQLNFRPAN